MGIESFFQEFVPSPGPPPDPVFEE